MKKHILFSLLFLTLHPQISRAVQNDPNAYIFSGVDHRQGISNSAVICIFQDDSGLMWFGTYDGVNCFDGREMEIFRSDFSTTPTLDNNVIYGISQGDGNNLWIKTMHGINRLSLDQRRVVANYPTSSEAHLCSNSKGDIWLLSGDSISYYNTSGHRFRNIGDSATGINSHSSSNSFVSNDGTLWIFPDSLNTGNVVRISVDAFDKGEDLWATVNVSNTRFHHKPIENIFYQNNVSFCFIDSDKDLYIYDIGRQSKYRIRNIASLLDRYGDITGLVPFYDDFIIAFRTNGLVRLRGEDSHNEEIIDQNLRVFCLYKDPDQGILWIGADGKGALMYTRRNSIATNIMSQNLSPNFTRQVRSVMTDKNGGLWFGTKGDGLIHINDYADGAEAEKAVVYFPESRQNARDYTRENTEFAVFDLKDSRYFDGFWIGSGAAGLYYHIYGESRLRHLYDPSGHYLNEVHDVYEASDTTLYVATANSGFRKLTLDKNGKVYTVKDQRQYRFFHEQQEIGTFFAMIPEGDSLIWLGSRERGLVRFNILTDEYQVISLREKLGRTVDDILCICGSESGDMFVGTTAGLVRLKFDGKKIEAQYTGREQGFLNDMIHGILEDVNGFLWLSTNKGLIKYNPGNMSSHAYYYSGGVHIGEFSDDAYYKCPYTGRLFFGGIDGLLYIDKNNSNDYEYYPEILLRGLYLGRNEVNVYDHISGESGALQIKYSDNDFSLKFAAPDFISGADIEYSWMLEGYDKEWQPFVVNNQATYRNVPIGNYIFRVRYRKDIFDTDFQYFELPLRIQPLWYQTSWALVLFTLLAIGTVGYIGYIIYQYIQNTRLTRKLLQSERKSISGNSAVYLNHELVDVLTSIYQSCDYLRAEDTTYEERCEKIERIRENVMSLFLPADIFHGADAGKFFTLRFTVAEETRLKEISDEVITLLKNRNFNVDNIKVSIPDDFSFTVYRNAFRYFFYYIFLLASDLRRSSDFSLHVSQSDGNMVLKLKSQKGLLKKIHASLTEEGYELPVPSRDPDAAFGMHLLHHFVRTMTEQLKPAITYSDAGSGPQLSLSFAAATPDVSASDLKSLLLLEDNDEMCWLISDILSAEYSVHQVKSIQQAFEYIRHSSPVVFVVDMMMYADAEEEFMEYMNRNRTLLKKTAFIPMLTWKVSSEMKRELVLLADSDIALPYDIIFLKEIAHKAIYGRKGAKHIQIEELGDFANQITCTTQEQAEFIRKVINVIEANIDKEDLGSSFIAEQMAMSTRQFYRKFKEISGLPPTELIKNYRMEKAAILLLNDELSIQDVIADVGIASRSYFYKEFTRRFGMTPKNYRDEHNVPRKP